MLRYVNLCFLFAYFVCLPPVASHKIYISLSPIDFKKQAVKAPVSSCTLEEAQLHSLFTLIPPQQTSISFQLTNKHKTLFFFRWSRCREGEKFKCCDEEVLTHSSTLITTFCLVSTDRVKWCRMEGSLYAIPSLNSLTLLLDCFSCQELD